MKTAKTRFPKAPVACDLRRIPLVTSYVKSRNSRWRILQGAIHIHLRNIRRRIPHGALWNEKAVEIGFQKMKATCNIKKQEQGIARWDPYTL